MQVKAVNKLTATPTARESSSPSWESSSWKPTPTTREATAWESSTSAAKVEFKVLTSTATAPGGAAEHLFKHGKGIESTSSATKMELLSSAGEAAESATKAGGFWVHSLFVCLQTRFAVLVVYFSLLIVAKYCICLGNLYFLERGGDPGESGGEISHTQLAFTWVLPHSFLSIHFNSIHFSKSMTHLDELLLVLLLLFVGAILALVRMVLQCQLLVRLLDLLAAGALPQTKDGIVVTTAILLCLLLLPAAALLAPPSAVLGARTLEE